MKGVRAATRLYGRGTATGISARSATREYDRGVVPYPGPDVSFFDRGSGGGVVFLKKWQFPKYVDK